MSKAFKAWFKNQTHIPQGDYSYAEIAWDAAVKATKEKAAKVCDDLYKHDRKDSGYDEGWNDALGTAENAIRSMK
jgi:hypothetical protein